MTVTFGGSDITSSVNRVITRHGADMRIAECDVDAPLSLSYPSGYETLHVVAGLTNYGGGVSTFGPSTVRFDGVVINTGVDHWPYTMKPQGRGWLALADVLRVPDDAWENYANPFSNPDPLLTPSKYDPPGIDMTLDGLGQTDSDQINYVLTQAGLTSHYTLTDIGGLSALLGTQVKAFEQFVWRRGQSGLEYIESLDGMFGFRTTERSDGSIFRRLTSSFAPFTDHSLDDDYTLNENRDILEGARIVRDITNVRSRVIVTGWDDGSGSNVWAGVIGASPLPPGVALVSEAFSSPMIEKQQASDPGDGFSCAEAVNYWLGELQYPMLEAVVSTPKDTPYEPFDLIYLNAPHLLGVNQSMWVKHIEREVTENSFTQTLTLRAQDFATFRGPPVLPFALATHLRSGP